MQTTNTQEKLNISSVQLGNAVYTQATCPIVLLICEDQHFFEVFHFVLHLYNYG